MLSEFFINRPIFSAVIAIIITLAGLVASQVLPIAQYPEVAPPTVTITANYTGASAETIAKTVAAPIEEQLSGVENLVYFSSSAASNGTLTITCTFAVGADGDKATIDVNNRVQIALPRLPDEVRRSGVIVQNGYAKNADIFGKNSRVKDVELNFSNGESMQATLTDQAGEQRINLNRPVKAKWVQLIIRSVYPGWKYSDTAVNELRVDAE